MKKSKKVLVIISAIILTLIFNPISCVIGTATFFVYGDFEVYINNGMEYYFSRKNIYIGQFELTDYWIPNEDIFWEKFQVINSDFVFIDDKYMQEETILFCNFEDVIYKEAKKFVLDNATLCNNHLFDYNNSIFIENLDLAISHNTYENNENTILSWSNYIGYNDLNNRLFFLGFQIDLENKMIDKQTFNSILEKYFDDFTYLF